MRGRANDDGKKATRKNRLATIQSNRTYIYTLSGYNFAQRGQLASAGSIGIPIGICGEGQLSRDRRISVNRIDPLAHRQCAGQQSETTSPSRPVGGADAYIYTHTSYTRLARGLRPLLHLLPPCSRAAWFPRVSLTGELFIPVVTRSSSLRAREIHSFMNVKNVVVQPTTYVHQSKIIHFTILTGSSMI